jgi:hypothetical protein
MDLYLQMEVVDITPQERVEDLSLMVDLVVAPLVAEHVVLVAVVMAAAAVVILAVQVIILVMAAAADRLISGTNQSNTPGDHSGHGLLTITYNTMQPICSSLTRTPVSVNVETSSVMPTALTSSLGNCGDGITPTTLSIVGGTLGTNADWKWYTGSCGGNLVGSGPSLVVTPTVTTTYYLRSESTGPCPATTCDSITIILVEAPTAVTATPNAFCGAGPFASTIECNINRKFN